MKSLNIIYLTLCISLMVGCHKGESPQPGSSDQPGKVVITMDLQGDSAATRASTFTSLMGVLGSAEYIVDRLRVYVFASDGKLDKMELYDNLNADYVIGKTIEVPKDSSKELYFVANEPASLSDRLAKVSSAIELEELDFTIAAEMNRGFNGADSFLSSEFKMPMTTTYSVRNAMYDVNIYVGLKRAVARVDLYLRKGAEAASREVKLNATTHLKAQGIYRESSLFEGALPTSDNGAASLDITSSDVTLKSTSSSRVLSFYVAEREYNLSNPITLEVDGLIENGSQVTAKSITLGVGGSLNQINRNTVYQITGLYNGDEIVADHFDVVDWVDVEVDAEIEGVMVAVDSHVAMDWLRNGNSYRSKNVSFGSNKPIEFYLPVAVGIESGTAPSYEFQRFEFTNMDAGASYNLKEIDLVGNYIKATKWIKSAVIHFTSPQSGYISFEYEPTKVNYKLQSYPIRIKSDNVTKQMMAVYDNGYLPSSLLSDDWRDRAPGGVVFAKRGEGKHPLTTPEILWRDDDGYYRGEHQTTAEGGSEYCKATFGDDWYMPSYADIQEIASLFDMLGVSYRFQNNGSVDGSGELTESRYWTSSISSSIPGSYWSANFTSRDYMGDDLMERRDGAQLQYVRCVKDIK